MAQVSQPTATGIPAGNQPCTCGSGLKHVHCCGQASVALPSQPEIARLEPTFRATQEAFDRRDHATAEQGCVTILNQAPGHARALRLLYRIRKDGGQRQAAEALLRRLVTVHPNNDWAACELSLMLYQRREMAEAETHARNAVRLNPDNPQAHNMMGMILTELNRPLPGEFHYRKALSLHGPVGKLCANLGLNLKNQGKVEEAEEWYRQAIELEPDNMESCMGWVRLEEARRNVDRAWELLKTVESKREANSLAVCITRSVLFRRGKQYDEALAALDAADEEIKAEHPGYYNERGNVLDQMGRYDEVFAAFSKANEITRRSPSRRYGKERSAQLAQRLKAFFMRSRVNKLPRGQRGEDEKACPIFVVGFPRSGTTLVEQMLSSHPKINAGDELTFLWDLTRVAPKMLNSPLPYPECLADLWFGDNQAALETFRDFYLKNTRQLGIIEAGVPYFTDKMPLNETNLGLIHLVFPEAPVIHLIRHPLDVMVSTFFNDFTHGANCSYSLDTAATHYALIRDLVDHYLEQMEINYLPIRYEDIVADPEPNCRKLLDFIGVEWDDRCLEFHENPRYARTASYAQVTERIYTRSVYRYKNYRKHLTDVIPILEPAITRLGYSVD